MREEVIVARVAIAAVASALLGWERERRERPAGLRTHMLVGLSSAAFAGLADMTVYSTDLPAHVSIDPLRVLQAIAAGVSFLGAGTVFVSKQGGVQGLTTAASLWAVSAIGVSTGFGRYLLAAACTALSLLILAGARRLERRSGRTNADPNRD